MRANKQKKSTGICDYKGEKQNKKIQEHLCKRASVRIVRTLFHSHLTYSLKLTPVKLLKSRNKIF